MFTIGSQFHKVVIMQEIAAVMHEDIITILKTNINTEIGPADSNDLTS